MTMYIVPFLVAFLLSVFLGFLMIQIGKKIAWHGRNSKRHIHSSGTLRVGGVAMTAAFIAAIFLNTDLIITPEIFGLAVASLAIAIFGFWDDLKELYWKIQLFFQVAVTAFIFIVGIRIYYITNPLTGGIIQLDSGWGVIVSSAIVLFWIILVMNAMNWIDGVDGLSGGIALISGMTIFILSLRPEVYQPPVAIIAAAFIGAVGGFFIFNFYPSRILAGTSGAMFMGFILATLSIISGTKIATSLLVLAIPLIDLVWVIGNRIKSKRSVFHPDRAHLHHKLIELGWSQRQVALSFYAITFLIAVLALSTRAFGKSVTLASIVALMLAVFIVVNRKIKLKKHQKTPSA